MWDGRSLPADKAPKPASWEKPSQQSRMLPSSWSRGRVQGGSRERRGWKDIKEQCMNCLKCKEAWILFWEPGGAIQVFWQELPLGLSDLPSHPGHKCGQTRALPCCLIQLNGFKCWPSKCLMAPESIYPNLPLAQISRLTSSLGRWKEVSNSTWQEWNTWFSPPPHSCVLFNLSSVQ